MSTGEWQTVVHRKTYPAHWRHAPNPPTTVKSYIPFLHIPTYAQALTSPPTSSSQNPKLHHAPHANPNRLPQQPQPKPPQPQNPSAQPHSTSTKPPSTDCYNSKHANLRFPPSPQFKEWRGRCFKCCRKGHAAAQCRNLRKCGRCWEDGHIGPRCPSILISNPPRKPQQEKMATQPVNNKEPSFDDLLTGPYPYTPKPMPQERPEKSYCYIERDAQHDKEIARLQRAVVLYAPEIEVDLTIEEVAACAVKIGIVRQEDISVAVLTRSRYLISLPENLPPTHLHTSPSRGSLEIGLYIQPVEPIGGCVHQDPSV